MSARAGLSHDAVLDNGQRKVGLIFSKRGKTAIDQQLQTVSTLRFTGGGTKFGDWEPGMSHIEQRSWDGGRGQEDYSEDPTRFFDSQNCWTWLPKRLAPSLQWKISAGLRDEDRSLPGNMGWIGLFDSNQYLENVFTASASYSAEKVYVWIRRVGSPGTLTCELTTDSGGDPNTVLQTQTTTISTITDTLSVYHAFDISTQALTSGTDYHVKVYGASGDNRTNHWEIGVNKSSSGAQSSSDGSSWTSEQLKLYYRVVEDDDASRWHIFFLDNTGLTAKDTYAVSEPTTGSSALYIWDETNDDWDAVTIGTGDTLSGVVKSVVVANNIAHMARGTAAGNETIFTFRNNAGTYEGQDDATAGNVADLLCLGEVDGKPQIWRYEDDDVEVSRSDIKAFNTDLVWNKDDIDVGDTTFSVQAMHIYRGALWCKKQDGLYYVTNDEAHRYPADLGAVWDTETYTGMAVQDTHLYFGWSHSVERITGDTLDDIGPWKGAGLPDGRSGPCSYLLPVIGWMFWAIDGGSSGTSSVLCYNGRGLGEVFRAPESGQRIRSLAWQPVSGGQPRLWISCGTDLFYLEFPYGTLNPLHDSDCKYMHEAVLVSSTIDMGAAMLPKFFKELNLISENCEKVGTDVRFDFQVDRDVGSTTWLAGETFLTSPHDTLPIRASDRRQLRYRLVLRATQANQPAIIWAAVLEGFARTPVKNQLNLIIKTSYIQFDLHGTPDKVSSDILDWLMTALRNADVLRFFFPEKESEWNDTDVILDGVVPIYDAFDAVTKKWKGEIAIVVREA